MKVQYSKHRIFESLILFSKIIKESISSKKIINNSSKTAIRSLLITRWDQLQSYVFASGYEKRLQGFTHTLPYCSAICYNHFPMISPLSLYTTKFSFLTYVPLYFVSPFVFVLIIFFSNIQHIYNKYKREFWNITRKLLELSRKGTKSATRNVKNLRYIK